MNEHPKYCDKCGVKACIQRIDLPTHNIVLKPGYNLVQEGEYKARPLPHGGLDLIRNHSNDSMLSDWADFNFHEHDFEVCDTIPYGEEDQKTGVRVLTPQKMESFIGDPGALLTLRRRYQKKYKIRVEPGEYFDKVYRNEEHIGYGINDMLWAYDALDEVMHSDEGFYNMAILKYTDKATRKADGILFAGMQNENWMNYKEGALEECYGCVECDKLNDRNTQRNGFWG